MNEFAKEKVMPGKLFYARISSYDGSVSGACPVEDIAEAEGLAREAGIENDYGNRWIVAFALVRNVHVSYTPIPAESKPELAPLPDEEETSYLAKLAPVEVMQLLRRRLLLSPRGQRNYTAYRCGVSLGKMLSSGFFSDVLDKYEAERELIKAAIKAGLSEDEATDAIRSGINAGRNGITSAVQAPITGGSFLVGNAQ